jgi:hypothetical protein
LLDSWHKAAADAKYDTYFGKMTEDFHRYRCDGELGKPAFKHLPNLILIKEGMEFTALERHIYFDKTKEMAWFDELLNTQMKICRVQEYW